MLFITILLGGLLIALTLVLPHQRSATAYIPVGFGIAFVLLGLLALRPGWRKHAMHLAAALGVLGMAGALFRAIPAAITAAQTGEIKPAFLSTSIMAALCATFVFLSVRTFITARRSRLSRRATETAQV